MTTSELAKIIGARGLLSLALDGGSLQVPVRIADAKRSYGNTRYRVEPIGGTGSAWVNQTRVNVKGGK
jgi:hypothetical protein